MEPDTVVNVETNAGGELYMAWTNYPGMTGLNLCTFYPDEAQAVETLLKHMRGLGLDPGPVAVSEETDPDLGVWKTVELDKWLEDRR